MAAGLAVAALGLAAYACDLTTPEAQRAYRPFVDDPLWNAVPPGYKVTDSIGVACQGNDIGGTDGVAPLRRMEREGSGDWRSPISFYRAKGSANGWTVTDAETEDDFSELSLEKHDAGHVWHLTILSAPGGGGAATSEISGGVRGVDICPDD